MKDKTILIVSPTSTHPPFAGNRSCILAYTEMLKKMGYKIIYLWIQNHDATDEDITSTKVYWGDNLYIYQKNIFHRIIEAIFRLVKFKRSGYFNVDDYYPYGIKRFITKILKEHTIHCVILNYIYLSKLLKYFGLAKKIIYTHDVFSNKYQLTGLKWFSVKPNDEMKAINRADVIMAIQENEAIYYRYLTKKPVITVYNIFSIIRTPLNGSKNILYIAGPNKYNIESIEWFIKNVFDEIIKKDSGINLLIGGKICSVLKKYEKNINIQLCGTVNNLTDFYNRGDIAINPTFNGTGLKIKTFEALGYGKVVIANSHSIEGIHLHDEIPIQIADTKEQYVNLLTDLFNNQSKIVRLKEASIKYIEKMNNVVETNFEKAIDSI